MPHTSALRHLVGDGERNRSGARRGVDGDSLPLRQRIAFIASAARNSLDARGTKTPSLTSMSSPRNV